MLIVVFKNKQLTVFPLRLTVPLAEKIVFNDSFIGDYGQDLDLSKY